jgi:nicotinamidase-related amidase
MSTATALLLIDVQEAMFSYPGAELYDGQGVMDRIVSLLHKARSAGTPVVYIQHTEDEEFTGDSPTWQISARIKPQEHELIVEKPSWDAFHRTNLHESLQQKGIKKLIIAGMQTEFCVDTTTRCAYSLGYECVLVQDAHSTFDTALLSGGDIVSHHNSVLGGRVAALRRESEIQFS